MRFQLEILIILNTISQTERMETNINLLCVQRLTRSLHQSLIVML
jgi:hypothetical protein